jgi:non-specific serine/threonine protein kinase
LRIEIQNGGIVNSTLQERLTQAFSLGSGNGLLHLGAAEVGQVLPASFAWWRDFASHYVTAVSAIPDEVEIEKISVATPSSLTLDSWLLHLPPMGGAEYARHEVLIKLWAEIEIALRAKLNESKQALSHYLSTCHSAWNQIGRVHFNLAENRKDSEFPFAFLASYTTRLSAQGKAQHIPLSSAVAQFTETKQKAQLLKLLKPVQRASLKCPWLAEMVAEEEIYHPLRWTAANAFTFLQDAALLEESGIVIRRPSNWVAGRPARPRVSAKIGNQSPSILGMNALLDFDMGITLGNEKLDPSEIKTLLKNGDGLQLIRGNWVEVNTQKLEGLLQRFSAIQNISLNEGLSFADAMRLVSQASIDDITVRGSDSEANSDWSQINAGPWLEATLKGLRHQDGLDKVDPGAKLKATLRPYQKTGVAWLYLLTRLGLGACLADDMGLGKTIQILSLLLVLKREKKSSQTPCLIVAPASLLANWKSECSRFAPSLNVLVAHPSSMSVAQFKALAPEYLSSFDLVISSYNLLLRSPVLMQIKWQLVVADEAQALKNPSAKQTQILKKIDSSSRIALTGTPIENRLSDLWSLFDFTHPGLLGSAKEFTHLTKRLDKEQHYGPLRALVGPFILRRLKTDKNVINDLPDKMEANAWCYLKPAQAVLYQAALKELEQSLENVDGMARRGLVLSYLMRFKQICNHPSQWQGDGTWGEDNSGKFARLREIAEVVAAKQEKMLVFTQFRETVEPLATFLGGIFGRPGLVLHGGTPVAKRRHLVEQFQDNDTIPFFILSLKAGGSGLNLTAASHVVHFDRWWNPAVENQATDRAFRIGQKRNVLVHKFVCRGTMEEKIDQMITNKQQLVNEVLQNDAELLLTEMSDKDLLNILKLDIHSALES